MTSGEKLLQVSWSFVFWLCCIAAAGCAMLYSAANGKMDPWAMPQMIRFGIGLVLLLGIALIDVRLLMRYSYLFYGVVLVLLIVVEVKGVIGGGAQRWIDLGFVNLQPSELMKPAIVLALARYFQGVGLDDIGHPMVLLVPLGMIALPVGLIVIQPDLGTATVITMGAGTMLFLAGVRLWKFAIVGTGALAALPIGWSFLQDYQKNRILTFLDPERDPLGSGYHIMQSKIALGSGGLFGKGFLEGTQSHLNFLPERQTDFIFTMLAEEMGLVGALGLIGLYVIVMIYGYAIAYRCRHQYGRLVALGISTTFFLYFFINMAMVMGLIPVVGVPLPLVSYGGTALFTLMMSAGLLMNIWVHRDVQMGVRGGFGDL
ncbi:MAG: rod shape-determining protein RodA [Rhodobacteraceae bacterium]|nr:rod shape-determining protein RodA [Paracoccaceae bacterium]